MAGHVLDSHLRKAASRIGHHASAKPQQVVGQAVDFFRRKNAKSPLNTIELVALEEPDYSLPAEMRIDHLGSKKTHKGLHKYTSNIYSNIIKHIETYIPN